MYEHNSSGNQQSYWPRGQERGRQTAFSTPRFNSRDYPAGFNYTPQSTYAQRDGQHRSQYSQNPNSSMKVGYEHDNRTSQQTWVNNATLSQSQHSTFYRKGNTAVYNTQFGSYEGNNMNQSPTSPFGGHQPFQQSNIPCLTIQTTGHHGYFQPTHVSTYLSQIPSQTDSQASISQEETDKVWLKQWLEQHHLQTTSVNKHKKTLKISEAQNLFQRYLSLNNQLKEQHDELQKNLELEPEMWNSVMAKAEKTKEEMMSVQNIFNDPEMVQDLEEKIHKRKRKRLWLKNRQRRRFLQKQEDDERRKVLHEKIDIWQKEIMEKDLAARKTASLKHEAGGVLGEVRRKLQDCQKLQELIKSLVKLRELRKSEGEKKGVYPKTSLTEDRNFTTRCDHVDKMAEERIKTYEDEEKALRVIIMEEEGEREKKEKQQRLEQKALLNLSKDADPLAEFRRYYTQADESIQYLIQIRREWDMYLTPDITLGSRVPDEDISAGPPTSSLWASVLEDGDQQVKNVE